MFDYLSNLSVIVFGVSILLIIAFYHVEHVQNSKYSEQLTALSYVLASSFVAIFIFAGADSVHKRL